MKTCRIVLALVCLGLLLAAAPTAMTVAAPGGSGEVSAVPPQWEDDGAPEAGHWIWCVYYKKSSWNYWKKYGCYYSRGTAHDKADDIEDRGYYTRVKKEWCDD